MKKLGIAAVAALLLSLSFATRPVQALPQNEVNNYYYDADWNLVGEKDILCSGAHYTWGITTGTAHMSSLSSSCSVGGGYWRCYHWDEACVCYVEDYGCW